MTILENSNPEFLNVNSIRRENINIINDCDNALNGVLNVEKIVLLTDGKGLFCNIAINVAINKQIDAILNDMLHIKLQINNFLVNCLFIK